MTPLQNPHRSYGVFSGTKSIRYLTTGEIARIVNLAVHLGRPLLVEGEAGCGKTELARAIAEELGLVDDAFVSVTVKSTSQAKDLLYSFDALRRLQDAQDPKNKQARDIWRYVELQPLGRALTAGLPALVLIDEVDKADIDFPNDLLDVLERYEFDIDDLPAKQSDAAIAAKGFGRRVKRPEGGVKPIVVITSNREKQLPEPFLRRCLYVKLEFPRDPALLAEIVRRNLGALGVSAAERLIECAVAEFAQVRLLSEQYGLQKPPATSELVDWVRALVWSERASSSVAANALDEVDRAVLFKVQKDLERWKQELQRANSDRGSQSDA